MTNYLKLIQTWKTLNFAQRWPIEKIKQYQLEKFKNLLCHAHSTVPMYRDLYESHNFNPEDIQRYEDIEKIPVIDKTLIRSTPLEKRVSTGTAATRHIHKETTSGSTGEPVEIWTDSTESIIQTMKGIRFLRAWGYSPFHNTVQLWRADIEPKKSFIQKLGLFRRELVSIMDEPETVVESLRRSRCDVLFASRSSLEIFGEEIKKRNVIIKPHILISSSEVLTDQHRELFRKIYGCETLEIYGCNETGNIAWECPDYPNNLHIDMESVLVNFCKVQTTALGNKMGNIVVTSLENFVMPFIRYDLGDQILLPENDQCSCGRTLRLLGKVFGRDDDILEYKGRKFNWHHFYNYFKNYLYIRKYKIIQNQNGEVEFKVSLFDNTKETQERCLSDLMSAFGDIFSPLNITFVAKFPILPGGKFKVIEKKTVPHKKSVSKDT